MSNEIERAPEQGVVVWQEFTEENAQEVRDVMDLGSADFFKWEEGENVGRFFPGIVGEGNRKAPLIPLQGHYFEEGVLLPDSFVAFNCPRLMAGERCPACDEMDRLKKLGEDSYAYKPGPGAIGVFLDRSNEKRGGQPIRLNKTITNKLTELRTNKRIGGNWADPTENGYDVIVNKETSKKGKGIRKKVEYSVALERHPSPMSTDQAQMMEWLATQPPIEQYGFVPTYEEALARMRGEDPRDKSAPATLAAPGEGQFAKDVSGGNVEEAAGTGPTDDDIPF